MIPNAMDPRVKEFQCIMPIANIPSVLRRGILSNERAEGLMHDSVALQAVQDKRHGKQVPGGLRVHQYANLYFHARNPMMFKRKDQAVDLCVLRVNLDVLKISGVVLADCNAGSDYVRFLAPIQWELLAFDDIYARDWRHADNQIRQWRHAARKCAEVLVPHTVEVRFLTGAYVVSNQTKKALSLQGFNLPVVVDSDLFFR
jgi:hypothetical protein